MRKIIHLVHVSLDGYVEGPNGEFDWPAMGPELSAYWPTVEPTSDDAHDRAFASYWRETPKVVFSRTLERADWNTRVIGGDLAAEVGELKRRPGKDMLLTGGSGLAASLTNLGLIDEYHHVVQPVVLGGGKPAFPKSAERLGMRLIDARTCDATTVALHYRPAA